MLLEDRVVLDYPHGLRSTSLFYEIYSVEVPYLRIRSILEFYDVSVLGIGYLNILDNVISINLVSSIEYPLLIIYCMKEYWNVLCICRLEACHKPIAILKHESSVHKCVISSKCI